MRDIKEALYMKNKNLQKLTFGALATAFICVATSIIQIPIPLGYMHFGNVCILLFAYLFPPNMALFAAGVGSALADLLTGYPQWIIPTLIIKSFMGFAISVIVHKKDKTASLKSPLTFLGSLAGIGIMIAGYTIAGCILYGNVYEGLSQIPGLTTEGIFGMIGFYLLAAALSKTPVVKKFSAFH